MRTKGVEAQVDTAGVNDRLQPLLRNGSDQTNAGRGARAVAHVHTCRWHKYGDATACSKCRPERSTVCCARDHERVSQRHDCMEDSCECRMRR